MVWTRTFTRVLHLKINPKRWTFTSCLMLSSDSDWCLHFIAFWSTVFSLFIWRNFPHFSFLCGLLCLWAFVVPTTTTPTSGYWNIWHRCITWIDQVTTTWFLCTRKVYDCIFYSLRDDILHSVECAEVLLFFIFRTSPELCLQISSGSFILFCHAAFQNKTKWVQLSLILFFQPSLQTFPLATSPLKGTLFLHCGLHTKVKVHTVGSNSLLQQEVARTDGLHVLRVWQAAGIVTVGRIKLVFEKWQWPGQKNVVYVEHKRCCSASTWQEGNSNSSSDGRAAAGFNEAAANNSFQLTDI